MRVPAAVALACALLWVPVLGAEEGDRSITAIWSETLRFGTDPEILDALTSIRAAKERSLTAELVRLVEKSHNDEVRSKILAYLGELKDASGATAAIALIAVPDDVSASLLRAAVSYLSQVKAVEAREELLSLTASRDEAVVAAAVGAIGALGGSEETARLMELYSKDDVGPNVKNQIILALGELRAVEALDLLIEIAGDREAERVTRMYACSSLGKIGDQKAVAVLTSILSEGEALLRAYAAAALGKLRAPDVAATLTQVLRDASWQVRVEAARAIADGAAQDQTDEELIGMLAYRARRDEVLQVRREAIRALGTIGTPDCLDVLRELYGEAKQSLDVRSACLAELIRRDLDGSMILIVQVVDQEWTKKTDAQKVLETTADQLSRAESASLEALYRRFLGSPNVAVRISAVRGIANGGMKSLADALRAATADAHVAVRREALAALGKLGIEVTPPAP